MAYQQGRRPETAGKNAFAPGDFFGAGNLQALALLQRNNELTNLHQAFVRAGVQPGVAALHDLHLELALLQIGVIDAGDFQLAARAGLDGFGDVRHLRVIEIQAGDGVVALGAGRFFFNARGAALRVEGHDAIALGVLHVVGKDGGSSPA